MLKNWGLINLDKMGDTISDGLSKMNNASIALKESVILRRSKLLVEVLKILKKYEYIKEFKEIKDNRQGLIEVFFMGTLNKCLAIKPRYFIKSWEIENYEKKFLPAKDFGIIIISTNKGLMSQFEAKQNNTGGVLIGYVY